MAIASTDLELCGVVRTLIGVSPRAATASHGSPRSSERELMRVTLLAVACVAGVVLTGCGGNGFDTAKVSDTVNSDLSKVTSQGVPVEVNCPEDVAYVQNGKFTCTGKVNGTQISFAVTMGAAKDAFTYEPSAAVITLEKAQAPIIKRFQEVARTNWVMNCGPDSKAVLVVPVGTIFECSIDGKYKGKNFRDAVRITVLDTSGNIDWKPFTPPKGFVPRQITPKPKPTPSGSSSGGASPSVAPSEEYITPELVTPTPSTTSTKK